MKFFTPNEDEDGVLGGAVDNYEAELNEGNYELDEGLYWTAQDEMTFITSRLEKILNKGYLKEWDLASLKKMIEKGLPVGLGPIVHLLSVVHLLENQKDVKLEEEFKQLEDIEAMFFVEADMPGPSLVYLNALREALSIKLSIKHSFISQTISSLTDHQRRFGILSQLALRVAIADWMNLFEQRTAEMKERLSPKRQKCENLLKELLPLPELQEKMTGVDECILLCLGQLKNSIGQINLPEFNGSGLHPGLP